MSLRIWWKTWGELVRKLVALVASFASMAGLLLALLPPTKDLPWWAVGLIISATFFLLVLVVFEFVDHRGHRIFAKSDSEGIRRYMHDWIVHGGRVAIWTRDMSWAQNRDTRKVLIEKARRNELILCVPESNELTDELAAAGAEVCAYGPEHLESPASRFTIAFSVEMGLA